MHNLTGTAYGGNINFGKAGLTYGTTTTITGATAVVYSINGRNYTKTIGSNAATPTTDAITGAAFRPQSANQTCAYLICLNASGDIKVIQGDIVSTSDFNAKIVGIGFPKVPDSLCVIGMVAVAGDSTQSGTWTFGSNNMNGVTGVTQSFSDRATEPTGPLTA